MFAIKFSMEKLIKFSWIARFFLPAINATVFTYIVIFEDQIELGCIIFEWEQFSSLRSYCSNIYTVEDTQLPPCHASPLVGLLLLFAYLASLPQCLPLSSLQFLRLCSLPIKNTHFYFQDLVKLRFCEEEAKIS